MLQQLTSETQFRGVLTPCNSDELSFVFQVVSGTSSGDDKSFDDKSNILMCQIRTTSYRPLVLLIFANSKRLHPGNLKL